MSTYAERKQRVYRKLAAVHADVDTAEPGTFPWEQRNRLLELVEQLPKNEQAHWKRNYLDQLKKATEPIEAYQARTDGIHESAQVES